MAIPDQVAARILAKCGRHCCICRRFEPLHLQVHHIVPTSEGGSDDEENLIAICLTCHSDVHARVPFGRRFSAEELLGHRRTVERLLEEGKLRGQADPHETIDRLISRITSLLIGKTSGEKQVPSLRPDSVEHLLNTAKSKGICYSPDRMMHFGMEEEMARRIAKERAALEELLDTGLLRHVGGQMFILTHTGFLAADAILAAGSERQGGFSKQDDCAGG